MDSKEATWSRPLCWGRAYPVVFALSSTTFVKLTLSDGNLGIPKYSLLKSKPH